MSKVEPVNTTDLRAAIQLGCRTMQSVFNADDKPGSFLRIHRAVPRRRRLFEFSECHSEAHVPGRHLNALLKRGTGRRR